MPETESTETQCTRKGIAGSVEQFLCYRDLALISWFKTTETLVPQLGKLLITTYQSDNSYVRLNVKSKGCVDDILE